MCLSNGKSDGYRMLVGRYLKISSFSDTRERLESNRMDSSAIGYENRKRTGRTRRTVATFRLQVWLSHCKLGRVMLNHEDVYVKGDI